MLMLFSNCGTEWAEEQEWPQNVSTNFEWSMQTHGKIQTKGGFKGSGLNVEYPQSGAGCLQQRSNVVAREACDTWLPWSSFSHSTQIHIKSSLNCHLFPPGFGLHHCGGWGRGGFSSVVLHPAVLLYKGIDHFLHGQVRDQLVLGQWTPGDGVKMAYPLQSNKDGVFFIRHQWRQQNQVFMGWFVWFNTVHSTELKLIYL